MRIVSALAVGLSIIIVIFGFTTYAPIFTYFNSTFTDRSNLSDTGEALQLRLGTYTLGGLRIILYGFVLILILYGFSMMQSREVQTGSLR